MTGGRVAIVDVGMGNLYSVGQACRLAGADPVLARSPSDLAGARGIVLPGVGAFGDAMHALRETGLDAALRSAAASAVPLLGICLGMQLLFETSDEFGEHEGLGILRGRVLRFPHDEVEGAVQGRRLKVPQVGWNRVQRRAPGEAGQPDDLLEDLPDGCYMYFVHSYFVCPADDNVVIRTSTYGSVTYASAVRDGAVTGCQFHPERSGVLGLRVYERFTRLIERQAG